MSPLVKCSFNENSIITHAGDIQWRGEWHKVAYEEVCHRPHTIFTIFWYLVCIVYFVLWHPHSLSGISASDLLSVSTFYLGELPGDTDGPAEAIAADKKGFHTPPPKVAECKNVKVA